MTGNIIKKNGEFVVKNCEDVELAEVALNIVLEHGLFNQYGGTLYDKQVPVPAGYSIIRQREFETAPENAVKIGSIRIHTGDPAFSVYVVRAPQGRPTLYETKMVQTAIWLPEKMRDWLKSQENMSKIVRKLIEREMQKK